MTPTEPSPVSDSLPVIGLIGGGQLARMLAHAAQRLGCRVRTLEREEDCPAAQVSDHHTTGDWNDPATVARWAAGCDVVTLENEFVEASVLARLEEEGVRVTPGSATLATVQDKFAQKSALKRAGLPLPAFRAVETVGDLKDAGAELGWPMVLKKRKQGYDGKGNATLHTADEAGTAWRSLDGGPGRLFVEAFCPFTHELAVMIVRGVNGDYREYPVVETIQKDHICHVVKAPAQQSEPVIAEARERARQAVEAVNGLGAFGVEMFLTVDGRIWINELAPRVHNSGHYTLEACACSQFENHIRAVMGWPLGATELRTPSAVMVNLLGAGEGPGAPDGTAPALETPEAHLHVYGKRASRKGRKMGHLTLLGRDPQTTLERASRLAEAIQFGSPPPVSGDVAAR